MALLRRASAPTAPTSALVLPGRAITCHIPRVQGPNGNAAAFINNGLIGSHVFAASKPAASGSTGSGRSRRKPAGRKTSTSRSRAGYQQYGVSPRRCAQHRDDFSNNQCGRPMRGLRPGVQQRRSTHGGGRPAAKSVQPDPSPPGTSSTVLGRRLPTLPPQDPFRLQPLFGARNYPQGLGNRRQHHRSQGFNVGCRNPCLTGHLQCTLPTWRVPILQAIENDHALDISSGGGGCADRWHAG